MNKLSEDSDKDVTPHKESNEDKGNQTTYKHVKPEKKPNEEPEHPLKEQK